MVANLEHLERLELTIGPAAKLVGCSSSWLRRLEEAGAIPEAERTPTGHRRYTISDVATIRRVLADRKAAGAVESAA